jgi:hypothetical protein
MASTEIKVKFVEDFRNQWLKSAAELENITVELAKSYYDGDQLKKLSNRISGKEGIVTENKYFCTKGSDRDYFEKTDNNFVIFSNLFCKV